MLDWLKKFRALLVSTFSAPRPQRAASRIRPPLVYTTKSFGDRSVALQAAHAGSVVAVVKSGGKRKWVLMRCPCGCGEDLALNLMRSHRPVWELSVNQAGQASLHPSVHATTCGAHFWLKNGTVNWCE